jgi:hypothetical protein
MPKAAMNQDDCFILGKHKIGLSREIGNMEPVSEAG